MGNDSALVEQLRGTWVIGSVFGHKTSYYGEYPYKVKERILALFPDCERVVHLFSGIIKNDLPTVITYDIKPELHPTICDDVRNVKKHTEVFAKAQLVISDPPYDTKDFEKYGVKPFDKRAVIQELGEIMSKHSFLCWLDTIIPMYSKKVWELRGHIGMVIGTNTRARMLDIWEHV